MDAYLSSIADCLSFHVRHCLLPSMFSVVQVACSYGDAYYTICEVLRSNMLITA